VLRRRARVVAFFNFFIIAQHYTRKVEIFVFQSTRHQFSIARHVIASHPFYHFTRNVEILLGTKSNCQNKKPILEGTSSHPTGL
jgi:hypothetical protein